MNLNDELEKAKKTERDLISRIEILEHSTQRLIDILLEFAHNSSAQLDDSQKDHFINSIYAQLLVLQVTRRDKGYCKNVKPC